ncbi:MAG: hypothetical protein AAF560_05725 [Acidobacteriota bacterium]
MSIRQQFDDAELARIRDAARDAEQRTSGEIVAYLVGRVDDHEEAAWKATAVGALGAAASGGLIHWLGGFWGVPAVLWMTLPAFAGGAAGYLVARMFAGLERLLIDDDTLERRVRLRAEAAFLDEELFNTRDRSGILIFLALFEHRAGILGDTGIHEKVGEGAWHDLVRELTAGIRAGRTTEALVAVIERCGELLAEHGMERRSDDRDELANEPRLRDR